MFVTKIFHPNVSKSGEICVNTLKKDWKPSYGIQHVLTVSVFLCVREGERERHSERGEREKI
jgi:ubiquitin-conjugating enzyme E2 S